MEFDEIKVEKSHSPDLMKTRRSSRHTIVVNYNEEEKTIDDAAVEEEVDNEETDEEESDDDDVVYQVVLIQQPVTSFTFESLLDSLWEKVELPSSLWGVHREPTGKYVAFSHLSQLTSSAFVSTDKTVLFEGSLEAGIFIRGKKVEVPSAVRKKPRSLEELVVMLREVEALRLCEGTGLEYACYSLECGLILEEKHRGRRCYSCSNRRTHLKKTIAQRLRRAAARKKGPRKRSANKEMEYEAEDGNSVEGSGSNDFYMNEDVQYEDRENEELQEQGQEDGYS